MNNVDIIIFDDEELSQTIIESYLKELSFECCLKKLDAFITDNITNDNTYKIVLVNIDNSDSNIFNDISLLSNKKNIKTVAMSYDNSANLQIKAFRAGVKDFLTKPLVKPDFITTIENIYNKYFHKINSKSQAKIFTAISNRKGDGKSDFLINLSKEIADFSQEKVLLLDFNNSQDNISSLLNADIIHNTNYYINNLTEDNAQALLSSVARYKNSSLYIMANSFKNKPISLKKDKLLGALNILKHHFKYIFIDKTPDERIIEDETLISISDEIFCVVLPFISSFAKIKNILDNYYKNKNVKIILNRYTPEDDSKIEQIQTSLAREVFWKIPKNFNISNIANNNNITLKEAAEGTDIVNSYIELAKTIVNRD